MNDFAATIAAGAFLGFVLCFALICLVGGTSQVRVLSHACESACERLGSAPSHMEDNLCVCENLTVMRGDYGQLFLGGQRH